MVHCAHSPHATKPEPPTTRPNTGAIFLYRSNPQLQFFIEGTPRPQGSKQAFIRGGKPVLVEVSKHIGPWRTTIRRAATIHAPAPLTGPVAVDLEFVMPRPKAMTGRKPTPAHCKRPDVDKLARAVLDALTGPCFLDDSQVVSLNARKRTAEPSEPAGVYIRCHTA